MKKISVAFGLCLMVVLLWTLSNCRPKTCDDPRNPECGNYDPCIDAITANADFKIYEELGRGWADTILYTETDTIIGAATVLRLTHKGKKNYDSLRWQIGSQLKTYTADSVRFDGFGGFIGKIDIRLIVYKAPNKACNPYDDGIDTVIKSLWIIPYEDAGILGNFRGHDEDNPNFTYTVEIGLNPGIYEGIKYLPDSMIIPHDQGLNILFDNRTIIVNPNKDNISLFGKVYGIGQIQPDSKTLVIDYYVKDNPKYTLETQRRFIGTRVL